MNIQLQLVVYEAVYAMGTDLDEPAPHLGIDQEDFNRFQITELFRAALLRIYPEGQYRLDITRRIQSDKLPTASGDIV